MQVRLTLRSLVLTLMLASGCARAPAPSPSPAAHHRVIVLIWDGLRPDSVNPNDTPNLASLRADGVEFRGQHASYPPVTMMNAASFATGAYSGASGFFGNMIYQPGPPSVSATGDAVDYRAPVFDEDYAILKTLDERLSGGLLHTPTLFDVAQKAGLKTAAVGKAGPAFLQDIHRGGIILDERFAWPRTFAEKLKAAGFALPLATPRAYDPPVALAPTNGDPTQPQPKRKLSDGVTGDPDDDHGSPFVPGNDYLMNAYLDFVLPAEKPDLSWVWLRNPDSTEHWYGPGTPNYKSALHSQDDYLGRLEKKLVDLGWADSTDIVVASDHGHSTVSGRLSKFPLRKQPSGSPDHVVPGELDSGGASVSGEVRLSEELTRAGFVAFDGAGCLYSPILSGIAANGNAVHPTQIDRDGSVCGHAGDFYTFRAARVPEALPAGAIVVASNGGSDYLYVPDHSEDVVRRAVRFLQSREELGPMFVSDRYAAIPGTLPLSKVHLETTDGRHPDIVVSFHYDEDAVIEGVAGTEYSGVSRDSSRGTHGSFSPRDIHNTLIAFGPSFRRRFQDELPTGNVDVAPTIARLFGLSMPRAEGRPLLEALANGPSPSDFRVERLVEGPSAAGGASVEKTPARPRGRFTFELHESVLRYAGERYTYFDFAKENREKDVVVSSHPNHP